MVRMEKPFFVAKKSGITSLWSLYFVTRKVPRLVIFIASFCVFFIYFVGPGRESLERYVPVKYAANVEVANYDPSNPCDGRRIFIYDLPPKFNVAVHQETRCNHSLVFWLNLCPRFGNKGYGLKLWNDGSALSPLGSASDGSVAVGDGNGFDRSNWFDTDSYMLEMIYHQRLEKYQCRTRNSSEADAFYVPLYTGLLALDYLYEQTDIRRTYERRKVYGKEIIEWLQTHGGKPWRRYGGRDHFLLMGRTTWDFKMHHAWGTGFSNISYVSNMTHLLLERHPRLEHEFAIPYPTSFHPDSPERVNKWMHQVETSERKYLFSYVGAPRPDSWSVRGLISKACIDAGKSVCNLVNCSVGRCSHDPIPIYESFLQSNFCLQPRGDTATRRSTFDCLISGAIPVFFHVDTAYTQYPWHLPEIKSLSIYIPEKQLKKGTISIHKALKVYTPQQIMHMRRRIMAIIPNLLYNDFENDISIQTQNASTRDAFETSIHKVLGRIAKIKKQLSQPHRCWNPFARCWM